MPGLDPIAAAVRTYHDQRALGHGRTHAPWMDLVHDTRLPTIFDANHVSAVRAHTAAQIQSCLQLADTHFVDLGHRQYALDPLTPPPFEARLVSLGFEAVETLQLWYEGDLRLPRDWRCAPAVIRPVQSEADWDFLLEARRLLHVEQDPRREHSDYTPEVTRGLHAAARSKAPQQQYFIAQLEGHDCAYAASYLGEHQVGMVEDVFTMPRFRQLGVASALIAHCAGAATRQGARAILIGGHTDDSPKDMYAAMGFSPLCLTRNYLKHGS